MELGNAAHQVPRFHTLRLQFCEELLERFPDADDLIENMRRALAGACSGSGDSARCDRLYTEWLKDDPQWG